MDNMESLYQEFKKYFDKDRGEIDYFLEVLKTIKEDRWEYSFIFKKYEDIFICNLFIKKIRYDNIRIIYSYLQDENRRFNSEIQIMVDDKYIYSNTFENDTLFIELKAFIERAEQRGRK